MTLFLDDEGFGFVGPVLVPIFPIFWVQHKVQDAIVLVSLISTNERQLSWELKNTKISFDNGPSIGPSEILTDRWSLGPGTQDLIFRFDEMSFPKTARVSLGQIRLNGIPQKAITLSFQKDSYWHYVPFVFMHSD